MSAVPTGRRSPRWAVWTRLSIPCKDGLVYLARLRLIQTPWFGIYLHDLHEADDEFAHNHPWSFISVVLRGGYVERVYPCPGDPNPRVARYFLTRQRRRFSAHRMGRTPAHRIVMIKPRTKTLILVGPRRAEWGFFVRGKFLPWWEFEKLGGSAAFRVADQRAKAAS